MDQLSQHRRSLPIIGFTLDEIRLYAQDWPQLVFHNQNHKEAIIRFYPSIQIILSNSVQPEQTHVFGGKVTPADHALFVALLDTRVVEAHAYERGMLYLVLSNKRTLTATPQLYEGWSFQGGGITLGGTEGDLL